MLPTTLPDGLGKLCLIVGIGILIWGMNEDLKVSSRINDQPRYATTGSDSLDIQDKIIDRATKNLIETANSLSNLHGCRLKAELIQDKPYHSIENHRAEIFEYIEGYYNSTSLHSGLGNNSLDDFEQILMNQLSSDGTTNRRYIIPKKDISVRGIDPLSLKHKPISSSLPKERGVIY
ncbi:MAG: IS3 family transposase [Chitinophagaceae bacterium]